MVQLINHLNKEEKAGWKKNDNTDVAEQIKFRRAMIRSNVCDSSDAYILVKVTIAMWQDL